MCVCKTSDVCLHSEKSQDVENVKDPQMCLNHAHLNLSGSDRNRTQGEESHVDQEKRCQFQLERHHLTDWKKQRYCKTVFDPTCAFVIFWTFSPYVQQ